MLRSEVEKKTGLSRKAIEYYEEKNLINPKRDENDYRVYSKNDLEILTRVSVYRKLGLSVEEIKKLLKNKIDLASIIREKERSLKLEEEKQKILKLLVEEDLESVSLRLKVLQREDTIYEKLQFIFPGYFGQLLFQSYKPFLNEKLDEEEEKYFNEYVYFVDKLPKLELTREEIDFIEKNTKDISLNTMSEIQMEKIKAIEDVKSWYSKNEDFIKAYENFKESEAFLNSPAKKIQDKLRNYMEENDYYTVAIPLLRKFSKSYDEYYKKLLKANEEYLKIL